MWIMEVKMDSTWCRVTIDKKIINPYKEYREILSFPEDSKFEKAWEALHKLKELFPKLCTTHMRDGIYAYQMARIREE